MAVWDNARREETAVLNTLIRDVRDIDCSSNVIGRLKRCIEAADGLSSSDYVACRPSFLNFLHALSAEESSDARIRVERDHYRELLQRTLVALESLPHQLCLEVEIREAIK